MNLLIVAAVAWGAAWLFGKAAQAVDRNLADLPTDDDPDSADLIAQMEAEELADDLVAIAAALQDGRVQASPEVFEVVELSLYELELGGAA